MDAVEFLKKLKRMCNKYETCVGCPCAEKGNKYAIMCADLIKQHPEDAVTIVEKWSAEHPAKTRQSEFLKMFPNATFLNNESIDICPRRVDATIPERPRCYSVKCFECKKEYWLAEVE